MRADVAVQDGVRSWEIEIVEAIEGICDFGGIRPAGIFAGRQYRAAQQESQNPEAMHYIILASIRPLSGSGLSSPPLRHDGHFAVARQPHNPVPRTVVGELPQRLGACPAQKDLRN